MRYTEEEYKIKGWYGNTYTLTAKDLYERILKDSKSDYNWIASATELVRVCNEPSFPEIYEQGIKLIILNCFANLELKKENPSNRKDTDNQAVYSCYHSLLSTDETVIKVKKKYLTAIICSVIKYSKNEVRFPAHTGDTYKKFCEDWKKAKLDEYASKEKINFEKLKKDLYDDFEEKLTIAEENGLFDEDNEEHRRKLSDFLSSIDLKDINFYL